MQTNHAVISLVGALVAGVLATTCLGGPALAKTAGVPDLRQLVGTHDLPAFAGYQTTSADRDASSVIVVPDASSCDEVEFTQARSFMGLINENSYVSGAVAAVCAPDQEPAYLAGVETFEGGFVPLPEPNPGDKVKTVITDDGETTTVTVTNLTTGDSVSASAPSVPDTYEVGVQIPPFDAPLVDGKQPFAKNRLDGTKLSVADPIKIKFDDAVGRTFKPTGLRNGINFKVKAVGP